MAHVKIRPRQVIVDGHDLSKIVRADDFSLTTEGMDFVLRFTVTATELDVDLPDVVVRAIQSGGED